MLPTFVRISTGSTLLPLGGFSLNFIMEKFIKYLSKDFNFGSNRAKIVGALHKGPSTFFLLLTER